MPAIYPAIDSFMVSDYLNSLDYKSKGIKVKSTRNLSRKSYGYSFNNVEIKKNKKQFTLSAELFSTRPSKTTPKNNTAPVSTIEAIIDEKENKIESCVCLECKEKTECPHIEAFVTLLLRQSANNDQIQNGSTPTVTMKMKTDENSSPYLLDSLDLVKSMSPKVKSEPLAELVNDSNNNQNDYKLQVQPIVKLEILPQFQPTKKHSIEDLTMKNLAIEFEGKTADEFIDFCKTRMSDMKDMCDEIQAMTVDQADTDIWHQLRVGRVTASRMYEASRCTMSRGSLVDKIMGARSGFSFAMKRGTDLEDEVFNLVKKEYKDLQKAGLVLDPECPFMGASPDGMADQFALEIKCPYTAKTHAQYIDVKTLSPKYFAQIQLQMHMTHKSQALLAVAAHDFETTHKYTKVWIDYDKEYTEKLLDDSLEFWKKAVFPAIMRKRSTKKARF